MGLGTGTLARNSLYETFRRNPGYAVTVLLTKVMMSLPMLMNRGRRNQKTQLL
jgi:hypothetical protein